LVVAIVTIARGAFCEPSVLLVVQGAADQDPEPCELRLRSELAAEGFEVVTAAGRSQHNILDLEDLARRTGAVAALRVFVDAEEIQGRLWVYDASTNVDMFRNVRVQLPATDAVSVFALRAVEALRGARLELEQYRRTGKSRPGIAVWPTEPRAPGSSSAAATGPAQQGQTPAASLSNVPRGYGPAMPNQNGLTATQNRRAANVGKSEQVPPPAWTVLASGVIGWERNDLGAVYGPGLDIRLRLGSHVSLGVAWVGPLLRHLVDQIDIQQKGSVDVDQEMVELQLRLHWPLSYWANLGVFGSVGGSRFAATGVAELPYVGLRAQSFGLTGGVGTGLTANITQIWLAGLDLQLLGRIPAPVIIVNNRAWVGDRDSTLLAKLGIGVRF
jgi:hypothetical protein